MATRGKKKSLRKDNLPNLKICVENTDELSKSSSESSEEEGEISEDDQPLCIEAKLPEKRKAKAKGFEPRAPQINRKMVSPIPSDEEPALNVDLEDLETFGVTKQPKKIYENKESGNFELGFDPTSKESVEKREERAKRFGIACTEFVPLTQESIHTLHQSLGISRESRSERGIRLDVIHLRGCDEMNNDDVFAYFQAYAPSNVEWIDNSSCNIVWADDKGAARAMWFMSDDPNVTDKSPMADKQENEKETEEARKEDERKEEKMEESDPDDLDLLSSDDEEEAKQKEKRTKAPEKERGAVESGSDAQMDTAEDKVKPTEETNKDEEEKRERLMRAKRILPPGLWRVGHPLPRNQYLFMRFATKADKKLPFAEGRNRYYQRYGNPNYGNTNYGNPNYGGSRGLISNSRKQRMRQERYRAVEEEAGRVINRYPTSRDAKHREFFNDRRRQAWSSDEEEGYEDESYGQEWHDHRPYDESSQISHAPPDRGYDESAQMVYAPHDRRYDETSQIIHAPRVHSRLQDVEIKRRRNSASDQDGEELDMEAELGELLRQIPEKRKMRMYADDEQDLMKRKRMYSEEVEEKPDLRSRLGNHGVSLSSSRQARRRRQDRHGQDRHGQSVDYRGRSESPEVTKSHKYEKITIQVDPDDV